jgi:hypothetical protein
MLYDLFGIQARGGCSCAGPYGHRLLGDYAFDPGPATGATTGRRPTRPCRWPGSSTAGPAGGRSPPRTPCYLEEAGELLAAKPAAGPGGGAGPSWLPPELERLRDFSLPPLPA